MIKVLVHQPERGVLPVGVWWLPGHRSRPKSLYVREGFYYTQGALLVLGLDYTGKGFALGEWDNRIERLIQSANPLSVWSVAEVNDPAEALLPA